MEGVNGRGLWPWLWPLGAPSLRAGLPAEEEEEEFAPLLERRKAGHGGMRGVWAFGGRWWDGLLSLARRVRERWVGVEVGMGARPAGGNS